MTILPLESGTLRRPNLQSRPADDPRMNRVLFLLGLSVLINYIDRSNLSIAAPLIKDELNLSGAQLGTLLAGFFYTYALLQIPAGWLVDRFDAKWVFGLGFFIWSASTAVTGLLHGFAALLIARVVLGIGESVAFPAYGKIIGTHFPESRRGFANAVVITGLALWPCAGDADRRQCRRQIWVAAIFSRAGHGSITVASTLVGMDAAIDPAAEANA